MSENELKVKTVEQNGKTLEFKEAIPISSLKFVSDGVIALHTDIDKLQQWFTAQQIMEFCRKKLNIEVMESLSKNIRKNNKYPDMIEVANKVFDSFSGKSVTEADITREIGELYPEIHTTTRSNWKKLVIGILVNNGKIVKDGKICVFSSKLKVEPPEIIVNKKGYDNARENGLD